MYSFPPKCVRCNSASAIWCGHKVNLDGQTDRHLRNLLYYLTQVQYVGIHQLARAITQ